MTVFIRSIDERLLRFDTIGQLLVTQERTTPKEGGHGEPKPMISASTPPLGAFSIGRPVQGTDAQLLLDVFAVRVANAESGIWGIRDGVIYCDHPLEPASSRTFPLPQEAAVPEEKK